MVVIERVQPDFSATDPNLNRCLAESLVAYRGTIDGELACVWGLIPPTIMSTQAYIWLQTFPAADEHPFLLVRWSQRVIEEALKEYSALVGHCRVSDERAIRWMRWLKAEFGDYQGELISFKIGRKHG